MLMEYRFQIFIFYMKELFPEIDFIACLFYERFCNYDETKFDIVFTMVRLGDSKDTICCKAIP